MTRATLKSIERKIESLKGDEFPRELREYEKRGAGYSELPDRLKHIYCRYWSFDKERTDEFVAELFDLPVCHKLNDKELKEREAETQKLIAKIVDEYNDPRAVAEREADLRARGIIQ